VTGRFGAPVRQKEDVMQLLDTIIWRVVDAVLLVAVISMVVLIALQVGSRLVGHSVAWTEELSRFLFIWTIWLGLAAGFRNGQHPALNFLTGLIPASMRVAYRLIPAVSAMILFGVVTWQGWHLMMQQIRFGEESAILQIGMWLTTLPLVLGAGLAILGTAVNAITQGDEDDVAVAVLGNHEGAVK
jgi:TRAP-type C4-dicarboxylate transport system permease small subunit